MTLRIATPGDSRCISSIVRESSAYKGEYKIQVEGRSFEESFFRDNLVKVCEIDGGEIVGFYSITTPGVTRTQGDSELSYLFVHNEWQGKGIGRKLFHDAVSTARLEGRTRLIIVAHPPSRGFYLRMGAEKVGEQSPLGKVRWNRPIYAVNLGNQSDQRVR